MGKYPNTWFLSETVVNTLKVQITPGGGLKNAIGSALAQNGPNVDGGSTLVVEMGGDPITLGMGGKDPFGGPGSCHMGPPKCNVDPDADCRSARVVNVMECVNCQEGGKQSAYI